jgi:allophanate hydrolase
VVVCGAHLDGLALNYQLRQRQGYLVEAALSAPAYRLYALADGKRPGMVRVAEGGRAIAVEVWALPSSELGSFLAGIPAPLGLGKVELEQGQWLTGFICENNGLEGATDITEYGGWRAWLASRENVKQL